jgi:hypothetical protein
MAMFTKFTGYFDASGHPDQHEVMTVAGFVSSVKKWSRYDLEWTAILKSEGITSFHTTEFVSSQGEFSEWKGQTERRRIFANKLWDCIKRNTNKACRTTLVLADYQKVNAVFQLQERLGQPYALCASSCLLSAVQWARRKKSEKATLYYFEDGDKDKGDFQRVAKEDGLPEPLFLPKKLGIAFQAADFASWKLRSSITGALKPDHTPEKGVRLLESVRGLRRVPWAGTAGVINADTLVKYCIRFNVPKR